MTDAKPILDVDMADPEELNPMPDLVNKPPEGVFPKELSISYLNDKPVYFKLELEVSPDTSDSGQSLLNLIDEIQTRYQNPSQHESLKRQRPLPKKI